MIELRQLAFSEKKKIAGIVVGFYKEPSSWLGGINDQNVIVNYKT